MGGLVDAFVNVVPYVSLVLLVVVGGAFVYFAYFQQDSTSGPAVFGANSDMQDSLVEPTSQTQGGYTRHYRWLQTENEVELRVPVPEGTTAKDVRCRISPSSIDLSFRNDVDCHVTGSLHDKVSAEDSVWTVENDEDEPGIAHVCVYLQKRVPTTRASMWPCVVEEDMNIPESRFAPPQIPDPDADPSE